MITKSEIIAKLSTCNSNEKKIEILEKYFREPLEKDTKKFVALALAKLYEKKNMISFALKYYNHLNVLTDKYSEKIPLLLKMAQLHIKQFEWSNAEDFYKQALSMASSQQAKEIESIYQNFFIEEATEWEKKKRYRKAIQLYEKLIDIIEDKEKKIFFLNKIADLYDQASLPADANSVRRRIELLRKS